MLKYIQLFENFEEEFAKEIKYASLATKSFDQVQEIFTDKITAYNPDWEEIEDIIELGLVSLNGKDKKGNAAIHYAAEKNLPKLARMLINANADVNIQRTEDSQTPLHIAVKKGYPILSLFVKSKGNLNIQDDKGNTPLFYAPDLRIGLYLIENGADTTIQNNEGKTAIDSNYYLERHFEKNED